MKTGHANVALLGALLIAGTAVAQNVTKSPQPPLAAAPPAAAGDAADLALVQKDCSTCHAPLQVISAHKSADEWQETMDRMVDHGMQIPPEDSQRITDFLVAHNGPAAASK